MILTPIISEISQKNTDAGYWYLGDELPNNIINQLNACYTTIGGPIDTFEFAIEKMLNEIPITNDRY